MVETKCGYNDASGVSGQVFLVMYGPTLKVNVGFDPKFRPDQATPPIPGIEKIDALVDTGATESCIDAMLAAKLNLPVVDRRHIAGVGGQHTVNMHLAQVYVPSLNFRILGAFAGVDLASGGQIHRVLIGRTFLANVTMVYEGRTGAVTISK